MKAVLTGLIAFGVMVAIFVHYAGDGPFTQLPILKSLKGSAPQKTDEASSASQAEETSDRPVTPDGPLARWMRGANPKSSSDDQDVGGKPHPNDHIAPSPVGTGGVILRRTFNVVKAFSYPFAIPAHAASPKLHGNFRSFSAPGAGSEDATGDIAFLLLDQQQYDGFIHGRLGNALMAVDATHNQNINFRLPASLNQAVTYYLVFENDPREAKKTVQADFRIDF
jgi:hypothetical protein